MTFACLWCSKRFIRSAAADRDSIDFTIYEDRSNPAVEEEIRRQKFAPPKPPIIPIDRDRVIPPILHAKIKIGNEIFERLHKIAGDYPDFQRVLKEKHLDVDRHGEGIIYSRFNGNDIKRFCAAAEDLAGRCKEGKNYVKDLAVFNSEDYARVIQVLRIFGKWSQLVSSTDTDWNDERLQELSCRDIHFQDGTCCQTAALGKALESIGGFGSSGLVHAIVMHLGSYCVIFITKHLRALYMETPIHRSCCRRRD